MKLSVVIPVFNEAESLDELHRELREVASAEGYELDLVFVDDGSRDASWEVIARLAAADPQVRGIRFRRNFGKAAALDAGLAEARHDVVMTMDADLQDDPHEIPRFVAEMNRGKDVVAGWKQVRHDPWHKVLPSRVFNAMVSNLTGVHLHDHNCGMKCYRREMFREMPLYGEMHRFMPVLAAARGYRVGELVIQHRARRFGYSKYGLSRFVKGFLDLLSVRFLTQYGQRPQHVLGSTALGSLCVGLAAMAWGLWIGHSRFATALIFGGLLLMIAAVQLFTTGLLAELLVFRGSPRVAPYSIAARTSAQASDGRPSSSSQTTAEPRS